MDASVLPETNTLVFFYVAHVPDVRSLRPGLAFSHLLWFVLLVACY